VDVWTIALDAPRAVILSTEEQARAARFHFERDRIHWTHARSALRAILATYVNAPAGDLRFVYGPHGKPAVDGVEFNMSHSRGWALIAVTRDVPVGVDLEVIRENVDIAKLLRRIGETDLPESTRELFHAWTRREAKTKASGGALMERPAGDVCVVDIDAPEGFAASLALRGFEPEVRYRS